MGRNVVILCPGENLKTFYLFKNLVFFQPGFISVQNKKLS